MIRPNAQPPWNRTARSIAFHTLLTELDSQVYAHTLVQAQQFLALPDPGVPLSAGAARHRPRDEHVEVG
jgi:hypothetical protein